MNISESLDHCHVLVLDMDSYDDSTDEINVICDKCDFSVRSYFPIAEDFVLLNTCLETLDE